MNKKHIGSSFFDTVKEWEKKYPGFREAVEEHKEKKVMGMLLKNAREAKSMSQADLARKSHIPQSVICRIESPNSTVIPRIKLFSKLARALGYRVVISLENYHKKAA
ncbi:MAG: hypothetical protein A2487_09195 [Candidatus Raymondbacteria bacterium RifOxyC12_full_50_8]|uniref:HTH cro/C1-type domain-containing protein n=1 Tax=Candidatus Raymondbacteria bacterium RIFOXYD12_FULL_49_13 TaxID=1817890 RepID=A0A1F7FFB3_UNCRA|nr:MAG: hypothetical protein A2248_22745 [Candidatus Raymondbacteria bacterium RIFOXYA2_FULL_49_16]OGJ94595.1 MAG: hypothetical protein A2350_05925 [Candidatus Raymondbacteria bacterium RifOxyB12_full_50_8]OGJ98865.1 MAG: hypothetical protein A2487_09195 [Candidatus Raymondbacteria bacterium RifOxyC12_full_50_8]OGK05384.1 MAG: hypothetical protein A2519_03695 [Candidatus Raymondbacteria bacterium RIFOXYD12_FULL_49_13]OGP42997.1 MAG: hypothetical protein A2324_16400 [Candidatus Raymondbacteria b